MHKVLLSLAANRFQKSNLAKARQCLSEVLAEVSYTTELWTEPMSSSRNELYLNQLAEGFTTLTFDELNERLKDIERNFGRSPQKRQLGIVPIDLDIMEYDGQQYHERDWKRPYVTSLIGELRHGDL